MFNDINFCCVYLQCSRHEEKLKTIQSNKNAVSPTDREQVTLC